MGATGWKEVLKRRSKREGKGVMRRSTEEDEGAGEGNGVGVSWQGGVGG